MKLGGCTSIVTGAASGLGLALTEAFLDRGASVVMIDIEEPRLLAEADRLSSIGSVRPVVMDVAESGEWDRVAGVLEAEGRVVDVLVSNAGVGTVGPPTWELTRSDWEWVVGVNLSGLTNGLTAFLPGMVERGRGHVVSVASAAGLLSPPGMAPYAATKHGIVAVSEVLYHELRRAGHEVGVTVVCPGLIETRMADNERNRPAVLRNVPEVDEDRAVRFRDDLEGMRAAVAGGRPPSKLAERILDAVEAGEFYVIVDEWIRVAFASRAAAIVDGASPVDPA